MSSKLILCAVAAASVSVLTACANTGFQSRTGGGYLANLQQEAGESLGEKVGTKTGKACSQNILGLVAMGDSTLVTAMTTGGISKPSTVDYHYTNFLGFYGEVCTVVTGE